VLATVRVAAHTVAEILNPFIAMFLLYLAPTVFVAAIAGVTVQAVGVAFRAGASTTFTVIKGESV
jgi:hypothetical protein